MTRCPGAGRHWFAPYGYVGLRAPRCIRHGCNAENPRPLNDQERVDWNDWVDHHSTSWIAKKVGRV